MFKIQRSAEGKLVVFTLSGRIKAAALAELQKLLERETGDHGAALDLKEVTLVDRDALHRSVMRVVNWRLTRLRAPKTSTRS